MKAYAVTNSAGLGHVVYALSLSAAKAQFRKVYAPTANPRNIRARCIAS